MAYPKLFEPFSLRGYELKNRLFFPPHGTSLGENGKVSDALIAYHEARARNGVGMIILEGMSAHESFEFPSTYISAGQRDSVPGFQKISRVMHNHGCRILGQLYHPGAAMRFSRDGSRGRVYSASAISYERYSLVPEAASPAFLEDLAKGYANAASNIIEGGLDGVEILGSMGYLIAQFLDPKTNLRQDRYGGSLRNRMRLLCDILISIRNRIGDVPLLGVRLSTAHDPQTSVGGDELTEICRVLESEQLVDYISVINGKATTARGWQEVFPAMHVEQCHVTRHSRALKQVLALPVLVAGRIKRPHQVEAILEEGSADLVGTVRALIADPAFLLKARENRAGDIRTCVGCNQACVEHRLQKYPVSCIQFPESGRELRYGGSVARAPVRRRVTVAGGGPAGMKAAVTLAQRGHDVTLYEATSHLGGQVQLAQRVPGREEFGEVISNLSRELDRAGVALQLDTVLTAEDVAHTGPDAVVIATGARSRRTTFRGDDSMHVVDATDVIRGTANTGSSVVVVDQRNDWVGPGVSQILARTGARVRLAVTGFAVAQNTPDTVRDHLAGVLNELGVDVIPYARMFAAHAGTARLQHTVTDRVFDCDDVDTIVMSQLPQPVSTLMDDLSGWYGKVHVIGDARAPGTVEEAVLEGLEVGARIGDPWPVA